MELHPDLPILTERLSLREFRLTDLDELHDIERRDDVARYLYWEPRTPDRTQLWLERRVPMTRIDETNDQLRLAVTLRERGTLIGDLVLFLVSREHRQGEIGYVFHPDHGGRGYATEASAVLLQLAFQGLGLHRVIGRCDARNTASARVLERLGMRREGHLVENEWVKGEWTDELVFAILDREWAARSST